MRLGSAPAPRPAPRRRIGRCHLSRPASLLEPTLDHDPAALGEGLLAACSAWSRHTITVKNDGSCSRRPGHGHPEHGPQRYHPRCSGPRVAGEAAGEANGCLGRQASSGIPGRAVCPALGPGGRWTPWHAARAPGASDGANEVGHASIRRLWPAQVPGLAGGVLAAGGRACQEPSGPDPPPWAWWENEAPPRAARSSSQARVAWQAEDLVLHQLR